MRFVLTEEERHLVAARRALVDYTAERLRFDAGRERPHDEEVYLQLHGDGSGSVWVEPSGAPAFRVLVFHDLASAATEIAALRSATELSRLERDGSFPRRFGDPRRGRAKASA